MKEESLSYEEKAQIKALLRRDDIQGYFIGYEYDIEQQRHQMIQEKRRTKLSMINEGKKHQRSVSKPNIPTPQLNVIADPNMSIQEPMSLGHSRGKSI